MISDGKTRKVATSILTHNALPGLNGEMGMVPRSTVVLCDPSVGHGGSWGDGALSNRRNTIVHVVVKLSNTMEMNRSTVVVRELVVDSNDDSITPAGLDWGSRHLSIDPHDWAFNAIRTKSRACDIKVVVDNIASNWCDLVTVVSNCVTTELISAWLAGAWSAVGQGSCGQSRSCQTRALGRGAAAANSGTAARCRGRR